MLVLSFKDENGEEKRIEVDQDTFTIGRHSLCDLTYLDGRLSREHLRIERNNGSFRITDLCSSNGTKLNELSLDHPAEIRDGDVIDLGGGLELIVGISVADDAQPGANQLDIPEAPVPLTADSDVVPQPASPNIAVPAQSSPAASEGFPFSFFIIAPLLGLFVLVAVIGVVVLLGGKDRTDEPLYGDDPGYGQTRRGDLSNEADPDPTPRSSRTDSKDDENRRSAEPTPKKDPEGGDTEKLTETAKVEKNAPPFLQGIARSKDRAFLTGEQASKVNERIKQLKGSQSLTANLSSAKKNLGAIKTLAASKNLEPQFLAIAAITNLGSGRGDVLESARSVADAYGKLSIQVGSEDFESVLLMVAAYEQAAAGDTMKMRNLLQELASVKGAPPPRTIRSIWYLDQVGKISRPDYDRALTFLAIGVIAQNPKDFGVNSEALTL